jgi:hypothetical protein
LVARAGLDEGWNEVHLLANLMAAGLYIWVMSVKRYWLKAEVGNLLGNICGNFVIMFSAFICKS